MSYFIGQQPATTFDSGIQDRFTGLTTNTVTLNHEISAEEDILVVWNNIVQDKNSYSVGGTGNKTVTLGGTLVSGDVVTVYYLNKVMQSVNPTAGSVGITELNVSDGSSGQALTTNGSGTLSFASVHDGTPNCLVYLSGSQTISDDTVTKITFDTEVYDSDSAFASNKFTVPSNESGKYAILLNFSLDTGADSNMNYAYGYIYKNGSNIRQAGIDLRGNAGRRNFVSVFSVEDLSATDYIEAYAIIDDTSGSPLVTGGSSNSLFMIWRVA